MPPTLTCSRFTGLPFDDVTLDDIADGAEAPEVARLVLPGHAPREVRVVERLDRLRFRCDDGEVVDARYLVLVDLAGLERRWPHPDGPAWAGEL